MDACDPTSFNAVLGAGTCARQGGVSFDVFIAQLTKHQFVGAWHFAPGVVNMQIGQTLVARNNGGEVHTFTEVENFGGGSVPVLNQLSGNPDPAPECLALTASDSIPPGGTTSDVEDESGTELYQCCIHPWMRAEGELKVERPIAFNAASRAHCRAAGRIGDSDLTPASRTAPPRRLVPCWLRAPHRSLSPGST